MRDAAQRAGKSRMTSAFMGFVAWLACAIVPTAFAAEKVSLINIDGAIGPATASYISRSIEEAQSKNAQCLIIQLNTPGGLLDSTQKIVQSFLGSPVPVVVYVAPTGATATSAGCFITIAASVAAMAPATTIGAAHPVSIGGFPSGGEEKTDETMKQKLENFSVSYIETIAGKRQRNVEWAKSAVKESASITAEKALQLKVIDLIASDISDLLQKLNGRVVDGKTLKTAGAEVSEIKMSASEHVFQKLWRPEVMFILMLIAIYGIIGELTTPGAILPGVVGAIALVLALYLAAVLPVNVTGLVLIALALMLFIFDVYATTHGVLDGRWNHCVSDRFAHALQSCRPPISFIAQLHYSGDIGYCSVLYFRHRKRSARATVACKGGQGDADWENSDDVDPNRFSPRPHFRRRRILERRQ